MERSWRVSTHDAGSHDAGEGDSVLERNPCGHLQIFEDNSSGYWLEPIERLFRVVQEVSLVLKTRRETDKIVFNPAL
jgi:hypothetical protein